MNNNHTVILLNIPIALQHEVLGSWLTIKDVAKMDSAICCRETRPLFLEVLAMNDLVLINRGIAISKIDSWMTWIISRNVCINQCRISRVVAPYLYKAFFACTGKRLEALTIRKERNDKLAFAQMLDCAASYCTNLKELTLDYFSSMRGLETMLRNSQKTICKLMLDCIDLDGLQVGDMKLPSLHILSIFHNQNVTEVVLQELLRAAPNLEILVCNGVNDWPADIDISHRLRVMKLCLCDITDISFCSLVQNCPLLEVVELSNCKLLTDTSVEALVQRADHLTALSLQDNRNFSDSAAHHIARFCGARMKHMCLDECSSITDTGLKWLSSECCALVSLGMDTSYTNQFTIPAIQKLLQNNPLLQEVSVEVQKDTDKMLTTLAASCPQLRHLDIMDRREYTKVGILAVMSACRNLRTVVIGSDCTVINELAQSLWQKDYCPGLEFLHQTYGLPFWMQYNYRNSGNEKEI